MLRDLRLLALASALTVTACGKPYGTDAASKKDLAGVEVDEGEPPSEDLAGGEEEDLAGPEGDMAGSEGDMAGGGGGDMATTPAGSCATVFTYNPGAAVGSVVVAGEWHGFDLASATAMTGPDSAGNYTAKVDLQPGLWAYKLVVDGKDWRLDPGQCRRKYVGAVENSAVKVRDCSLPSLKVQASAATRAAAGQGRFTATLAYVDGSAGLGPDPAGFTATLDSEGSKRSLTKAELTVDAAGKATVQVGGLADGKYTIVARAKARGGKDGEPLRLVFWIEAEAFSWKDALIYMVMTDRFADGDKGNNAKADAVVDPRADWQGGDLQGVAAAIRDGTLDKLGVRAIWLSPFNTNPQGHYLASDGKHQVQGYHGYWPVKAREVDPRIGGNAALKDMVKEAHKHGIRILQDFVANHVHEDHEYMKAHPDWFRTGCVCGTANCDWTAHALDCMFNSYMPDVNYSVPAAAEQFTADAVWWLDSFNLDGLRVDAVKHVEEVATRNLSAEVREAFEAAGTRYFLMGETAMGWDDCNPTTDPNCNAQNYDTISRYIGPCGLDGQFDFVLYHGVSYRTFAYGDKGMYHADFWSHYNLKRFPAEAIMTPYIDSHDTQRFVSLADYRGQAGRDRGVPSNQWDNVAAMPLDDEPYARHRVAMAWLLSLYGAPLLYYGSEYGQWGGADPNNRKMWRPEAQLDMREKAALDFVRKLGTARKTIPALRRGTYEPSLLVDEDVMVVPRKLGAGQAAIVGWNRAATPKTVTLNLATLGFAAGTVLKDRLSAVTVQVPTSNSVSVTLPAQGAVVLAP